MKNSLTIPKRMISAVSATMVLSLSLFANSALADPFRSTQPQNIGQNTEAAFKAIFMEGNYPAAQQYLRQAEAAEPNEPLAYAMLASLAYREQDWESLKLYATKTRQTSERLVQNDPLRGNLYAAVGHFLEGAYDLVKQGTVRGAPQALNKLQLVFRYLREAEKLAPNDPELNLLKGYMDLMLSVNLPFSNPAQAVDRLERYAAPSYLAYRGIAIAYRDLKDDAKAIEYVDRAIAQTPNNPELNYLKAQILTSQNQRQEAGRYFQAALARPNLLPKNLVAQIFYEQCRNQNRIDNQTRNCDAMRDPIRQGNQAWGPETLPPL
ncbi:tetratricopeptide repeat protein [Desertifilum sp. FACHB-1129]|nr:MULTISPECIES: Sll0314/Alr1548 family TPR repeat-containing protein [Desertifilum]MBD2315110.1 tetratricopeptide repeat protein [Desertifilum sp. FACHB-1129]MBD2325075.1 tetratricopeptide repeat protein [Desertifilum sp. FACHB-866]MBD2335250.1 tetratricopeptide repeat protein [Desertifilum sp. FACHB-868]